MSMVSLVYVSVASHLMTDGELQDILAEARDNNQKQNITGMLLYRDGYFIQALEGDDTTLDPLYAKIKEDERHGQVLTVLKQPIEERSFDTWAMGFNKLDGMTSADLPGFTDFLDKPFDHEFFQQHPGRAVALLQHFRDRTFF